MIREYGAARLSEGYDLVIVGHYHEPLSWSVPGGEVRILDAWFRSRRVEWLGDPSSEASVTDPADIALKV